MPTFEVIANSITSGVLLGGTLALTALGLSIALGVMRLVNLAHGELLVGGAYLGYFLLTRFGIDPLWALPLIGGAIGCLSYPLQRILITPLAGKGMEASMMTMFAVSIILQNLYLLVFSADTRAIDLPYASTAIHVGGLTISTSYLIGFAVSIVAIGAVYWLTSRTHFGRELRASASDPIAASINGVNVKRVHSLAFALGAGCAAMGGVLVGTAFAFTPTTGAGYLLTAFTIVVLGGLGSIPGTLIGGVVLGVLQSFGDLALGDAYRDLVGLTLFLVVLTFRPAGMFNRGAA